MVKEYKPTKRDHYAEFSAGVIKDGDARGLTHGLRDGIRMAKEMYSDGKYIDSLIEAINMGESLLDYTSKWKEHPIKINEYTSEINDINDIIDKSMYGAAKTKNSLEESERHFDAISKLRLDIEKAKNSQNPKSSKIEKIARGLSIFFFFLSFLSFSFPLTGNVISTTSYDPSLNIPIFFLILGIIFGFGWVVTKKESH